MDRQGGKIRVLLMDDHAMVRQGLRTFLELQDASALPIEVTGEAANGVEAVELARRTQPDIVLLDLVMPEMDGIQATPRIIACSPRSRVSSLSSFIVIMATYEYLVRRNNVLRFLFGMKSAPRSVASASKVILASESTR